MRTISTVPDSRNIICIAGRQAALLKQIKASGQPVTFSAGSLAPRWSQHGHGHNLPLLNTRSEYMYMCVCVCESIFYKHWGHASFSHLRYRLICLFFILISLRLLLLDHFALGCNFRMLHQRPRVLLFASQGPVGSAMCCNRAACPTRDLMVASATANLNREVIREFFGHHLNRMQAYGLLGVFCLPCTVSMRSL